MKFCEVNPWNTTWIIALLVAALALGPPSLSINDILLPPLSPESFSDLVVEKSCFDIGKKAQVLQHSSQADNVTPVKKQRKLKLKSGQTPPKATRELSRTKSIEAAARAVRLKLGCFPRSQS